MAAVAMAAVWLVTGRAAAADFIVESCGYETPAHVVSAAYDGGSRVEALACMDAAGLMQLNGRGGASASGEYGAWTWQSPAGERIVSARMEARLRNAGGWAAQLYAERGDGTNHLFGIASDDAFHAYGFAASDVGSSGAPRLVAQLRCYRAGGCDLATLGGATNRSRGIELTIRDSRPPTVSASGPLVDAPGRWHRGIEAVQVSAGDDGSGVRGWSIRFDGGETRSLGSESCPGDRGAYAVAMQPCPASAFAGFPIDTASLADGSHSVQLCAADFGAGANVGCTAPASLLVDNGAPLQPESLEVAGGEDRWHAARSFDLMWTLPPQSGGSQVSTVHVRVLDPQGGIAVPERTLQPAARLDDLTVPNNPGVYTAEVWLEDAAGNTGAAASAKLRFDDRRPSPAHPTVPGEWLSRGEVPVQVRLEHPAAPLPASGIEGYAVSIDAQEGGDPCDALDRCSSAETDLKEGIGGDRLPVSDLPEGVSYVHAAAVSGSGMKSALVRHAELRFDRTDPVTALSGAASGWSNQPLHLVAHATDELSGMDPAPGGAPATYIRIDGRLAAGSPGATAEVTVDREGAHEVAYYARDLAGNIDDGIEANGLRNHAPATEVVRIDLSGPELAFAAAQDPGDLELIRASVNDPLSGPDPGRGVIGVRRAGDDGAYSPLPTAFSGGALEARWDSDAFPAGRYEFAALAYDRAGNTSTTTSREGGDAMVLTNPLKARTMIRLRASGNRALRYGSRPLVGGALRTALGAPVRGLPIELVERFAAGSTLRERVTGLRTAAGGRFSALLGSGPTRAVLVRFAGDRRLAASSSPAARIRVAGVITLRTSSGFAVVGGRPLVFSGRVGQRLAEAPAAGKRIDLQYRLAGGSWKTFRSIHAAASGAFSFPYRFVDQESRGTVFNFRAVAGNEGSWPYSRAVSAQRTVVGR
jgi:hypothetical protein